MSHLNDPARHMSVMQIEIGQLDTTIGVSEVPFGNLTYWFEGSSLYLSINLTAGMMNKPIGVFVNQTNPPIGPPPRLDNQVIPALSLLSEEHGIIRQGLLYSKCLSC